MTSNIRWWFRRDARLIQRSCWDWFPRRGTDDGVARPHPQSPWTLPPTYSKDCLRSTELLSILDGNKSENERRIPASRGKCNLLVLSRISETDLPSGALLVAIEGWICSRNTNWGNGAFRFQYLEDCGILVLILASVRILMPVEPRCGIAFLNLNVYPRFVLFFCTRFHFFIFWKIKILLRRSWQ